MKSEIESPDYTKYKVGGDDGTGNKITAIYNIGEKYIIYKTNEKALFKYHDAYAQPITAPIDQKMYEAISLLKSENDKDKFRYPIVTGLKYCLENEIEVSKQFFDELLVSIKNYKKIKSKNAIQYLSTCLLVLVVMIVISVFVYYCSPNNIWQKLVYIATGGCIGGFFSVALRIEDLISEVFEEIGLNFISAVIRMIIAILSSIVLYFLIRSNIVLGVFKDKDSNFFVIIAFSIAAGFFEKKVPDLLKSLDSKIK